MKVGVSGAESEAKPSENAQAEVIPERLDTADPSLASFGGAEESWGKMEGFGHGSFHER